MGLDGLDELAAHRIERIEAGERILEDRADPGATHLAHLLVRQIVDALALEPDLARGDAAGRLEQADDGVAGQRLARARLAHHAQHLARRDVERYVVDGHQRAAPRREFDAKVLHLEQRRVVRGGNHQRSFGLRASRSQSPSRLTASTRAASVTPGKTVIHHSPDCSNSLPSRISVPRDGCVEGRTTPRNERGASEMIARPSLMVAITSTGPVTLGSTWRTMIRVGDRPMTRAACTYSLFFSTRTEPRTVRAYWTQKLSPMAPMMTNSAISSCLCTEIRPRTTPSISSATRMAGNVSCTSAMRMITASVAPPT